MNSEMVRWTNYISGCNLIKSISIEVNDIPIYFCSECCRRNREPSKDFVCDTYLSEEDKICESKTWSLRKEDIKDEISGDFIRLWKELSKN